MRAPADSVPVARLARRAGGSIRTLERRFRQETGLGIGAWRRRLRLLSGIRSLEAGASVTEAALEAGYATPSGFTAAFTRTFGVPPTRRRSAPR